MRHCALLLGVALFCAATSEAATQDTLAIGDTTLSLSSTSISFSSASGNGTLNVGETSTGAYSGLGGTGGSLSPLSLGGPTSNFLSLAVLPTAQFTVTSLGPGYFSSAACFAPPASGQVCSPIGSPFVWINTDKGAVLSFSAAGQVTPSGSSDASAFTATFTAEFVGQNYQTLLQQLSTGGTVQASYSASVSIASGPYAGTLNIGEPSLALSSSNVGFDPTTLTIGAASTGGFVPYIGTDVSLLDITAGSGSVPDFLSVLALPQEDFTLTSIGPGTFSSAECASAPAAYQVCSLIGSPFSFINMPGGAMMFFTGHGTTLDTATLDAGVFDVLFSTQYGGRSFQDILAAIAQRQSVYSSFSAEFLATPAPASVPEPGTLALALLALVVSGFAASRRHATAPCSRAS